MTPKYYQVFIGLNMFQPRFSSIKKLAKKVTRRGIHLNREKFYAKEKRLLRYHVEDRMSNTTTAAAAATPRGFLAVYVGEERQRFVVPTSSLSHPLFKILLAKAGEEFGYEQKNGLAVPCSVAAFQEVVTVIKCCRGMFDFQHLVPEFIS
ncbi:putative small auxin-up RNA [Helianthus annuus]|nr:putative small auxin-up RNA [Helianthus annuus]KAJ0719706.1 putative small auxin-up RNA [Helianthus annuus]KAJ0722933.1 putative small auxin-up RNA [Helianthus annuus]